MRRAKVLVATDDNYIDRVFLLVYNIGILHKKQLRFIGLFCGFNISVRNDSELLCSAGILF